MAALISLNNSMPFHRWHKMLTFIGAVLLFISFTFQATWLPSHQVGLLGMGFLLYGLGDWKAIRTRLAGNPHVDWIATGMKTVGGVFLVWVLALIVKLALGFVG